MAWVTIALYGLYFFSLFFVIFWITVYLYFGIKSKTFPKLKVFPTVTVVVPAWNEEDTIIKTLNSLIKLDYPKKKLEIIIVNDGSTDRTRWVVEEFIKKHPTFSLKLINQKNAGKAAGMNKALKVCKGEIYVCLDADSFIDSNALQKIIPYFVNSPYVGVVMPLMKIVSPKNLIQKIQWCEYMINYLYKRLMSKLDMVHVAPGPFSVYRKHILVEVGGFDEKVLTEDLEMTLKIQKADYKIIQMGDVEVYTNTPKNFKAFYRQRNRWYKGSIASILKHKDLIFNKKYGDFGFFQAPFILLNGAISLFATFLVLMQLIVKPLSKFITNFSSLNFNFELLFSKFDWGFLTFMGMDYLSMFMALLLIVVAIYIIGISMKHTKEKLFKYGVLVIPVYLFFYGIVMSVIWLGVFFDLLRGKFQRW